jgi:prepilin-type N-terminal cleavage/methylation domain-containing protein
MRRYNRNAFTLVELLAVIVILALLVGLLLPAVMRAVGTARDAAVAAEINQMTQALAQFHTDHNIYPPSRIIVSEIGDYSTGATGAASLSPALATRSLTALRRIFPRMALTTIAGALPAIPGRNTVPAGAQLVRNYYDFNGNDKPDLAPYLLEGPECLVLFLGGVPQPTQGGYSVSGFGKNPLNPFENATVQTNRMPPYMEFNAGRLVDLLPLAVAVKNGVPEYRDSLGGPAGEPAGLYAYFSAYAGSGYDPDDTNFPEPSDDLAYPAIMGAFQTGNAATGKSAAGRPDLIASPAPNPYTNDAPIPTDPATGDVDMSPSTGRRPRAWQNPQTYQIISAGRDFLYGIGGQYSSQGTGGRLPLLQGGPYQGQSYTATVKITGQTQLDPGVRQRERDNITNFTAGRME